MLVRCREAGGGRFLMLIGVGVLLGVRMGEG